MTLRNPSPTFLPPKPDPLTSMNSSCLSILELCNQVACPPFLTASILKAKWRDWYWCLSCFNDCDVSFANNFVFALMLLWLITMSRSISDQANEHNLPVHGNGEWAYQTSMFENSTSTCMQNILFHWTIYKLRSIRCQEQIIGAYSSFPGWKQTINMR